MKSSAALVLFSMKPKHNCARVIYIFSVLQKNLILLMVVENQKTYRLGSIVKEDFNILLTILW
jgi:hypothetical protein